VSIWFQELGMKFGAFQRSQGEVQQNVKPRSPRWSFDHVDPVGRSHCQVGPVGRSASPLPGLPAPLCSHPSQVLRGNISPYGDKKESEAMKSVHPQHPVGRPHMAANWPLAAPSLAQLSPNGRPWDSINTPYSCLVNTHHIRVEYHLVKVSVS
jgi:hypothetical protein